MQLQNSRRVLQFFITVQDRCTMYRPLSQKGGDSPLRAWYMVNFETVPFGIACKNKTDSGQSWPSPLGGVKADAFTSDAAVLRK
jgi:hypothetical protein